MEIRKLNLKIELEKYLVSSQKVIKRCLWVCYFEFFLHFYIFHNVVHVTELELHSSALTTRFAELVAQKERAREN